MQIWGRTQPVSEKPIEQVLTAMKTVGFEGVELCLENPDIAPENLTEQRAQELGAMLKKTGFQNYSISYHKNYIYDDRELELTLKAIRLLPHFGANIFVFAGGWPLDESKEEA
jgi:sugar phosphate isomerase/epimerase